MVRQFEEVFQLLARTFVNDAFVLGSGVGPTTVGDDRSGRFWRTRDARIITAIKVAIATGRPLLLEGPSGTGKSALAKAVAKTLGWDYYEQVVTLRTSLDELLWSVDHLGRLRDAHTPGHSATRSGDIRNYILPGVLWWALDPAGAAGLPSHPTEPGKETNDGDAVVQIEAGGQAEQESSGPDPSRGVVVLIDEIDKADPDLANSLLVPLGSAEFRVDLPGATRRIKKRRGLNPLMVVTSNDERSLPDALRRRCISLGLTVPPVEELRLIAQGHVTVSDHVLKTMEAKLRLTSPKSIAAYVDAARAVDELELDTPQAHATWELLAQVLGASRAI